jgi:transcriptional regulator with XRE-family HTH domain
MSSTAAVLNSLLERRQMTRASFARLVGVSPAFITQVLSGKSKVPLKALHIWCAALRLEGYEFTTFVCYVLGDVMCPRFVESIRASVYKAHQARLAATRRKGGA